MPIHGKLFNSLKVTPGFPRLVSTFRFGVDGIALVLIALAATLVPVVILGGWDEGLESQGSVKGYFALILVLESLMVGVFAATDVFLVLCFL